jgi:hypothetical protein
MVKCHNFDGLTLTTSTFVRPRNGGIWYLVWRHTIVHILPLYLLHSYRGRRDGTTSISSNVSGAGTRLSRTMVSSALRLKRDWLLGIPVLLEFLPVLFSVFLNKFPTAVQKGTHTRKPNTLASLLLICL